MKRKILLLLYEYTPHTTPSRNRQYFDPDLVDTPTRTTIADENKDLLSQKELDTFLSSFRLKHGSRHYQITALSLFFFAPVQTPYHL